MLLDMCVSSVSVLDKDVDKRVGKLNRVSWLEPKEYVSL